MGADSRERGGRHESAPSGVGGSNGEGRLGNASAALLIGGTSSRMGRDKAALELGGESFAGRLSRLLDRIFGEVLLVGGTPPDEALGRRVADRSGPSCALRGLVTALAESRAEQVLVLATDMPLMTADLILALTAWPEHAAVVPRHDGRIHALPGLYHREAVLPIAERRLDAGQLALQGLLDELETGHLEGADLLAVDPTGAALTNVNTPQDLLELE